MSGNPPDATYDLAHIQELVRQGSCIITGNAFKGAAALAMTGEDIKDCVLRLTAVTFHKTMESTDCPGLWQDVYKPLYQKMRLYVKLQLSVRGDAVVISFKEK